MSAFELSDFLNGGSIKGMIAANDKFISLVNDDTKIVPGHGISLSMRSREVISMSRKAMRSFFDTG